MKEEKFEPQYPAELYTSRPNPNALLSPIYDWTFKAIFTQESEDSNLALRSFLSAVLERTVSTVTIKSNEPTVESKKQKRMTFDISVSFDDGEKAEIEMQAWKQSYDYGERAEIMAARLLSHNAKRGKKWEAPNVYQISVLNFHYRKDDKGEMSWYTMKDRSGKKLTDKLNIIFIDLANIRKKIGTSVEKLTPIEKWGLFLSYIDDQNKSDYINSLINSEEGIMAAEKIVKTISKSNDNWEWQNSLYKAECDYNTNMKAKWEQGLKQGIKQGLQQGIKQGLQQGAEKQAIEDAKALLKEKIPPKTIAKCVKLSLEKVLELKSQIN